MVTGSATYSGEEITATFSARSEKCDLGVTGSPVWYEWQDFEIVSLEILGVTVFASDLTAPVMAAIFGLAGELEFEADG